MLSALIILAAVNALGIVLGVYALCESRRDDGASAVLDPMRR